MQTVGKKVVSVFLTLIMVISIMAVGGGSLKATAAGYDPDAAISYAKAHWNDGSGDCQVFLKACLKAGGVTVTAGGCLAVKNALVNGGYGTLYKLTASGKNYKFSDNSGKVSKGDPLFFVCTTCGGVSSSSAWPHVALCGEGLDGYITDYAHNSAHNGATHKLWKDLGHSSHPNHTMEVYAFHMNTSSTPTTTPDTTAPTATEYGIIETTQDGFTVYCYFDDNVGVTRVQFPTWTPWQGGNNGQDDLIWYEGNFNPDGKSAWARIPISNHNNELGAYTTHIYVWDAAGNCSQYAMGIVVERDAPVISDVVISDITTTGYTVTCTVTDENNINRVQFPSWHTWDDLQWLNGSMNGSSVSCRVNISNFGNATGTYGTHIYAYDIWGNVSSVNAGYIYVPSENERYTVTYNANGGTGAPSPNSDYVNVTLRNTQPTRNGYNFLGWAESANATAAQYQPGERISPGRSITLYAVWKANAPVITPVSGAAINSQTHQITGLAAGGTVAVFEQNYVSVSDGSFEYEYPNEKQVLGTGTIVKVYDIEQKLVDTYTVVIFGDIDGDGWYDGTDAYFVKLAASGMVEQSALTEAQRMAADCNHDGTVDNADVALLEQAGLLLANVDQTLPSEELQTDSVYLEYCSLIEQTVEIIEPEQPAVDQPAQTAEQPAAPSVWGWIKALFTIVLNWLLRVF